MKQKILILSVMLFSLLTVNSVYADFTVSVDVSKSLTENTQTTVTITVTNPSGSSTESSIVTTLSSSTSWFSVVTSCATIETLSAGQSGTSTCIIKPTSTGSDLSLTAVSQSQGGTSGSGSTSGINVASQSSSLTASVSSASSVGTSATFYVGVTVTAPSGNDVGNARATISESGQCTVDTSYIPAQQNLGNVTKGTSKSSLNWKLTSSSASGTCSVTVNVVSDVGGSAAPSKSITVGTAAAASTGTSAASAITGQSVLLTITGKNIFTKEKTKTTVVVEIPSITTKSVSNFSIDVEELALTGMKIKVVNNVTNVQITAAKLDARPSRLVSDAPNAVNQYLEITKANISEADIEQVTLDFKVDKDWISQNNINESTIALYRYEANDRWNALETTKVSEDSKIINYQAISPGLSVFAITGAKIPRKAAPETPEEKQPAIITAITKYSWKMGLIIIGSIVGIVVLVYLFRPRKSREFKKPRKLPA